MSDKARAAFPVGCRVRVTTPKDDAYINTSPSEGEEYFVADHFDVHDDNDEPFIGLKRELNHQWLDAAFSASFLTRIPEVSE